MDASKKNKQNIVSDNRGITLIELLIGIAIMGIVSSMISVIMVGGTNFSGNRVQRLICRMIPSL